MTRGVMASWSDILAYYGCLTEALMVPLDFAEIASVNSEYPIYKIKVAEYVNSELGLRDLWISITRILWTKSRYFAHVIV